MQKGLNPVFVFDGKPSEMKRETLRKRHEIRTESEKKATQSLKEGNLEEARKMGSMALKLTPEMVGEAKELLELLGVPVVQAPEEGEAQASVMVSKGQLNGVISQDFDCLLFGATDLYRNIGVTGKRKVPGKNFYVDVKPEYISLHKVLSGLEINREKLIWMGILIGTDFNNKVPRIGAKTALKLVNKYDSFEEIITATKYKPDFDYKEIEKIFLEPNSVEVDISKLKSTVPDKEKIIEFLVEKHDFSRGRVETTITKMITEREEKEKQKSISQWF